MRPMLPRTALLLLSLLSLNLSGCATIFHGTSTDISINSEPARAKFRIVSTGGGVTSTKGVEYASGVTPANVSLSQKSEYIVYVKAEGYEEAKIPVQQTLNGWLICSGLCGLIPAGIDVLTGGMWNLKPDEISVSLVPVSNAVPAAPGAPAAPTAPGAPAAPAAPALAPQPTAEGGPDHTLFVVLRARGEDGQVRYTAIPLLPEIT